MLGVGRKRTRRTSLKARLLGKIPPQKKSSLMVRKKRMSKEEEEEAYPLLFFLDW